VRVQLALWSVPGHGLGGRKKPCRDRDRSWPGRLSLRRVSVAFWDIALRGAFAHELVRIRLLQDNRSCEELSCRPNSSFSSFFACAIQQNGFHHPKIDDHPC